MSDKKIEDDVKKFLDLLDYEDCVGFSSRNEILQTFIQAAKDSNDYSNKSFHLDTDLNNFKSVEFNKLYDELNSENKIGLDEIVQFINLIFAKEDIKNFLILHANKNIIEQKIATRNNLSKNSYSFDCSAANTEMLVINEISNLSLNLTSTPNSSKMDKKLKKNDGATALTYDFKIIDLENEDAILPLDQFNVKEQENLLITDLLFVLVGLEGKYIRLQKLQKKKRLNLVISEGCDKNLKTLVNRILAFCPMYSLIIHFSENYGTNLVNQAFIGFIRSNIKAYYMFIAQIEIQHLNNDMTLQKMWFLINSFYNKMEILKNVCYKIKNSSNEESILSIMNNITLSNIGSVELHDFCINMTKISSKPFFEILKKWLTHGEIIDYYKEFFIEIKDLNIQPDNFNDFYWENKYQLITNKIPIFLVNVADKILKTGKYINVLRQIKKDIKLPPFKEELVYSGEDRVLIERIETVYKFSSESLLNLMLEDCNLIQHLHSFKIYFFMERGDFIGEFMDIADEELNKNIEDIVPTKLESLLGLAANTSLANVDPNYDLLGIELIDESILTQFSRIMNYGSENLNSIEELFDKLKGYEAVGLTYKVEWPLILIFNQKNMACYQMLFRYLFFCKYVERRLQNVWLKIKNTKKQTRSDILLFISSLLQKMLDFVLNLEYYMMIEVIEPNFHILFENIKNNVKTIDKMIEEHNKFIYTVFNSCMLNEKYAFQSMSKLFKLCTSFCQLVQNIDIDALVGVKPPSIDNSQMNVGQFKNSLFYLHNEFLENFLYLLKEILKQQNENYSSNMLQILCRLDFSGFYSSLKRNKACSTSNNL